MKSLTKIFYCFVAIMFLQSCMPEMTEIWVNKDESGKMEMTFDMGEMADMAMGMLDKETGDGPRKSMWDKEEKMDTTINFYDQMPDSLKNTIANAHLLKQMNLHMNVDSKKKEAKMRMNISYKNMEELEDILKVMSESKGGQGGMAAMMGDDDMNKIFADYKVDYKNGVYRMPPMDLMSEIENDPEMVEIFGNIDSLAQADPEAMMMFEMMFGNSTKTKIHLPGKVQFTNDMNAKIDGNTVIFEDNVIEIMKSGKKPGERLIKFKK